MVNFRDTGNLEKLKEITENFTNKIELTDVFYKFLENLSHYVYISDINTYEILWVNNSIKEIFGNDLIGKKCYEVFHNLLSPCDFCTNNIIKENGRCLWFFHNKKLNRDFIIEDKLIRWKNNEFVRLEIAIDITDIKDNIKHG